MPARLKRACRKAGCAGTTTSRDGFCDNCRKTEGSWSQWQQRKGNTTERGYGAEWRKIRRPILERDSYLCQPCKRKGILTPANIVDHIVSKANKGTDEPHNLETICDTCHKQKTATERSRRGGGE